MLKLSTRSQYGLRALVYMAQFNRSPLPLRQIAENEGIPFHYLEKIFRRLRQAGLIKAKRGVNGGYLLARSAKKIGVAEIVNVLEKDVGLVKCLSNQSYQCPYQGTCKTIMVWQKLNQAIQSTLRGISLADLIN